MNFLPTKNVKKIALIAILTMCAAQGFSQSGSVSINTTGNTPDASAILDVSSTNQGVLVPRMTQAQRIAISNPATGLMVYQTDGTAGFYFNSGTAGSPNWTSLNGGGSGTVTSVSSANTDISVVTGTTTPTLTLNSGTGANQIVKLDGNGKLPAVDGSALTSLTATPSGNAGGDLTGTYPNPTIANGSVTVSKMASSGTLPAFNGSALTNLNASNISSGTVATARLDVGTSANQIVKLDGSGKLPAVDGSQLTNLPSGGGSGTVTNVSSANTDISVAAGTTTPTLTLNSGTGANQLVKLDGNGKLPAIDGSQLTNLPSGGGSGTVTNVSSANTDISVATGTSTPTLTLNSGTGANQIVKLDGSGKLPAVDGSQLTNLPSGGGSGGTLSFTATANGSQSIPAATVSTIAWSSSNTSFGTFEGTGKTLTIASGQGGTYLVSMVLVMDGNGGNGGAAIVVNNNVTLMSSILGLPTSTTTGVFSGFTFGANLCGILTLNANDQLSVAVVRASTTGNINSSITKWNMIKLQ